MKSKLYNLKEWFTLNDAASHLTSTLEEEVTVNDILQLAIQKRIRLSVNLLSGAYANKGVVRDINEARVILYPAGLPLAWLRKDDPASPLENKLRGLGIVRAGDIEKMDEDIRRAVADHQVEVSCIDESISETEVIEFDKKVQMLSGIYDLPMLSAEQSIIEELYYSGVGGPDIKPWGLGGVWLERDGYTYRLCERMITQSDYDASGTEGSISEWEKRYTNPSNWIPSDRLPEESAIVLRRTNLDTFIASIETSQQARKLGRGSGADDMRALEALGLLVETFAKQAPKYQVNAKPNRSQIAEAMSAQAGEVSGMGKRKLQDLLTDALDAWEKKRG